MTGELLTFDQLPVNFVTSVRDQSRADVQAAAEFRKRSGLFTASELHKLLTAKAQPARNATARNYICEKAWERLTGTRVERGSGFRETDWGNEWEVFAIEEFSRRTGIQVEHTGKAQKFHKADGFPFGATLDGCINPDTILEAKCPFNGGIHLQNWRYASDLDWFKSERFEYYVQVQGGMWASDRRHAYFVSFDPGVSRERDTFERTMFEAYPNDLKLFHTKIPRDEQFIDLLKSVVLAAEKELQEMLAQTSAGK